MKVAGAGGELTNRVHWRMRVLARVNTAPSAPVAVLYHRLRPGQMYSCYGSVASAARVELLTADVVTR